MNSQSEKTTEKNLAINPEKMDLVSSVTLQGGAFLHADFRFEYIQNTWHQLADISEVHLNYHRGGNFSLYPLFGVQHTLSFYEKVPYYSFTSIVAELDAQFQYAPTFMNSYSVGLNLGQITSHDIFLKAGTP